MTPALEAETERLLSQRTRDIRFSPEMDRLYRAKDWPQRSKIARSWMVWVALISISFVPVSYLLAPHLLWLTAAISGVLVPALHACTYLVWRKPRSASILGLSIMLLMSSVMLAYGLLAVAAGGAGYERILISVMFVNTIALVVLNVDYIWTLSLMVSSAAIFFGFEIFNPQIELKEAIGTSIFYAIGMYAATIARKTQSILGQKAFLMSLRNQYRSDALQSANRQLEILATRDPLTGLANRRSATDLIDRLWRDPAIPKARIAFIMADIDLFKLLNDTAGHAAGDDCIRRVAKAIEESVRRRRLPLWRRGIPRRARRHFARSRLGHRATHPQLGGSARHRQSRNSSRGRLQRRGDDQPRRRVRAGRCRAGDGRKMGRRRPLRRQAGRQECRVPVQRPRRRGNDSRAALRCAVRPFGAQFSENDDLVGG
ncbi:MAG: diguanylate cyclase [Bradyrhizobium sp.]|nr:diguanylate cyclase [Bradyrhizobium sp.]MDO9296609.1 diguanylate cyclase [Bradyrhizobium sp.]